MFCSPLVSHKALLTHQKMISLRQLSSKQVTFTRYVNKVRLHFLVLEGRSEGKGLIERRKKGFYLFMLKHDFLFDRHLTFLSRKLQEELTCLLRNQERHGDFRVRLRASTQSLVPITGTRPSTSPLFYFLRKNE